MKHVFSFLICSLMTMGFVQAKDVDLLKKNSKGHTLLSSLTKANTLFSEACGEVISKNDVRKSKKLSYKRRSSKQSPSTSSRKRSSRKEGRKNNKKKQDHIAEVSTQLEASSNKVEGVKEPKKETQEPKRENIVQVNEPKVKVAPLTQYFYVDANAKADVQDGSIAKPFATIQAAIKAVPQAETSQDVQKVHIIAIAPGTYDEDLEIGPQKRITLLAMGPVNLGQFSADMYQPEDSDVSRNIIWTARGNDFFTGISDSLTILSADSGADSKTKSSYVSSFRISGDIIVQDATPQAPLPFAQKLRIQGEVFGSVYVDPTLSVDLHTKNAAIHGDVKGKRLVLQTAEATRFYSPLDLLYYQYINSSEIQNGMKVSLVPLDSDALVLRGMYATNLAGTFEGPARSLVLDPITNFWFVKNGNVKAGGATKVILNDSQTE